MASKPDPKDGDVTVQPSISTDEAAQTDVEGSPVGDEKVRIGKEDPEPVAPEPEPDA